MNEMDYFDFLDKCEEFEERSRAGWMDNGLEDEDYGERETYT